MRLAILFSGQGNQRAEHFARLRATAPAGLRPALAAHLPEVWQAAAPADGALAANRVAQPLIFGLQMTLWAELQAELPCPVCVAGYSLGEMAACAAAGVFTASEGIGLCRQRAELMDTAAGDACGMAAILGLDATAVATIASAGGVSVAIRNGPRHFVVAGPRAAVAAATATAERQGATRTVLLAVQTPSHTARLQPASERFAALCADYPDARLAFPVVGAIDGIPALTRRAALAALARQISTPLDWLATMTTVIEMQPDAVLEIGPGNALCRLLAEVAPALPARATDDFRSTAGILGWIGSFA